MLSVIQSPEATHSRTLTETDVFLTAVTAFDFCWLFCLDVTATLRAYCDSVLREVRDRSD